MGTHKSGGAILSVSLLRASVGLIVGDKEIEAKTISIRERGKGDLGAMAIEKFVEKITEEINRKI